MRPLRAAAPLSTAAGLADAAPLSGRAGNLGKPYIHVPPKEEKKKCATDSGGLSTLSALQG